MGNHLAQWQIRALFLEILILLFPMLCVCHFPLRTLVTFSRGFSKCTSISLIKLSDEPLSTSNLPVLLIPRRFAAMENNLPDIAETRSLPFPPDLEPL